MGVNSQLAFGARNRAKALSEAKMIGEKQNFIKKEFLSEVKGIGEATKIILIEKGVRTVDELKQMTADDFVKIGLTNLSIININKFLTNKITSDKEKLIKEMDEKSLDGELPTDLEVTELKDEVNIEVNN